MIELIIKTIIIFVIANLIEFLILYVFKVNKQVAFNFILNNIFGVIILFLLYYLKIFILEMPIKYLILVSSTGVVGLIGILLKILIF